MGVGGGEEKVSGVRDSCESVCGCSDVVSPCDVMSGVARIVVEVESESGFVTLLSTMCVFCVTVCEIGED